MKASFPSPANSQAAPSHEQRNAGRGRGDGGSAAKSSRKKSVNESAGVAAAVVRDRVALRAAAAANKPDDQFTTDGRMIFERMAATRKEQILSVFTDLNSSLLHAIGYAAHLKTLSRPLGDAGLQAGIMEAITIDYLPVSVTMDTIVEVLQKFDPSYSYRDIAAQSRERNPNHREDDQSAVGWRSIKLDEFIPTQQFLDGLYARNAQPAEANRWFFRRDFFRLEAYGARVNPTPELKKLLHLASLMELTHPQVEFWLRDQFNAAYKGSNLEGAVIAVEMQDKKFPRLTAAAGQLGRVTPVIVDYWDACNITVYYRDEQAVRAVERWSEPTVIALGQDDASDRLLTTVVVMPIKSKDKKRQMWESWEADSIGKAKEEALRCGGTVSVLRARLDVAYTPEGKASPLPTLVGAQRALVDALGGEMKGVHSADILCDDRHHPQYHRGVTICIIETPGTLWTDVLVSKLRGETSSFWRGKLFASIRLKGEPSVTRLSDAPAEEEELSKGEIMCELDEHLYRRGPLFIPKITKDGQPVVWSNTPTAPVTPFDQIVGSADQTLTIDDRLYRDCRSIFSKKVSPAALYSLLLETRDREIFIYEGTEGTTSFDFYELHHPSRDPYRDGAANMPVDD